MTGNAPENVAQQAARHLHHVLHRAAVRRPVLHAAVAGQLSCLLSVAITEGWTRAPAASRGFHPCQVGSRMIVCMVTAATAAWEYASGT